MRKGVGRMRRIAAILSVTVVALMATGTGAGAVTAPKLVNFSSVGSGQVLSLDLKLPAALDAVLQPAGLSSHIQQVVSFSRSIGQVDKKVGNLGTGLGQMMEGTLNPLLESTLGLSIDVLGTKKTATATHAFAEANTLKIGLAPLGGALFDLTVAGPSSMAEISGSSVLPTKLPAPLPTTGVPTTAYFLAGPALLGLAVLVRRFSLAHN